MSGAAEFALRNQLVRLVAQRLGLPASDVDADRPLGEYGLQSIDAVGLSDELATALGRSVEPTVLYRYPTIAALSRFLAEGDEPSGEDVPPRETLGGDGATGALGGDGATAVAVIGLGCRFPGDADTPEAFWNLLIEGRDGIGDVPVDRWAGYLQTHPEAAGLLDGTPPRGGFLGDIAGFDATFFGISPREARAMDPQQRIVLEVAWEALRHAGIAPDALAGSDAGVFLGACSAEYGQEGADAIGAYSATGSSMGIIASRLSYLLGVHGPSMVVDTACSASLVATHLGVRAIQTGECRVALVGGVSLILSPTVTLSFTQAGVLSADGRCKTFDAGADGYGRGEGCGVAVLKRLADAQRDGDRVLAVIRGGAVGHNGRSNGLMAPSAPAQESLLRRACRDAGVDPGEVDYVEAHGTGTVLGDQMEISALGAVLGPGRSAQRPLLVGAVKSNLGHLEAAAGIAGLIKVVLSLWHGVLPPSLNLLRPNPLISFGTLPVQVVTRPLPWPRRSGLPIAGVSAFGFGGANAHLVLEAVPAPAPVVTFGRSRGSDRVFALSGGSWDAVRRGADRLASWLDGPGASVDLDDIGHTLATRVAHGPHRAAVTARSRSDLRDALRGLAVTTGQAPPTSPGVVAAQTGRERHPVLVFPGQGPQWPGMGRDLLATQPVFAGAIDELTELVRHEGGFVLADVLRSDDPERLAGIEVIQPALFAMQVAQAALLRHYGVHPVAVIGHSMGEIAAGVVAGALSVADGVRIVCRRSRILATVRGRGAMALVSADVSSVERYLVDTGLGDRVGVAVLPSPDSVVVAGDPEAVARLMADHESRDVLTQRILVDVASHSPQMDPLLDEVRQALSDLSPARPALRMYSTVAGDPNDPGLLSAEYWARNLRQPVRFSAAVLAAAAAGSSTFLEVSPHPVLLRSIAQTLAHAGVADPLLLAAGHREAGVVPTLLASVATLHCHGYPVRWSACYPSGTLVDLPAHTWDHRRYWLEPERRTPVTRTAHPLLAGHTAPADRPDAQVWRVDLLAGAPWLAEHTVARVPVLPLAAHAELLLAAARHGGMPQAQLRDLAVHEPLPVEREVDVQVVLHRDGPGVPCATAWVYARRGSGAWRVFSSARVRETDVPLLDAWPVPDVSGMAVVDLDGFYADVAVAGVGYGPAFRVIRALYRRDGRAVAEGIAVPPALADSRFAVHPSVIDAGLQALAAALPEPPAGSLTAGSLVSGLDRCAWWSEAPAGGEITAVAQVVPAGGGWSGEVTLYQAGQVVGMLGGVRVGAGSAAGVLDVGRDGSAGDCLPDWVYDLAWRPEPAAGARGRPHGTWLLICDPDAGEVADAVCRLLTEAGAEGRIVAPKELSAMAAHSSLSDLAHTGDLDRVLYLGALDPALAGSHDPVAARRLVLDVVRLVQAVGRRDVGRPRLGVVTCHGQVTDGCGLDQSVSSAQAALWGMARCVALELPDRWLGIVDLDRCDPENAAAQVVDEFAGDGGNRQVAYREGTRLGPRLRRGELPAPGELRPLSSTCAQLVIGGTGRLGPSLLRALADAGAGCLVVVTRRGSAGAVDGSGTAGVVDGSGVAGTADSAGAAELVARGVRVVSVAADVADPTAMEALFARFGADLPPLEGIVHAAFAEQVAPVAALDAEQVDAAFAAKVDGVALLDRLSAGHAVRHFVCYSSTTGLLGSQHLAGYAAASCFVDALMLARRARGLAGTTVDWGPWAQGLAGDPERARIIQDGGLRLMATAPAASAVGRILAVGSPAQVVIVDADWPRLREIYGSRSPLRILDDLAPTGAAPWAAVVREPGAVGQVAAVRQPGAVGAPSADRGTAEVGALVTEVMGLPPEQPLNAHQNLFSLGLDSLLTLMLRRKITQRWGQDIPTEVFIGDPTVAGIAAHLWPQDVTTQIGGHHDR